MIVIVEGVDRVGKTTLCNMLHDKLGFKIVKDDVFTGKWLEQSGKAVYAFGAMHGILKAASELGENIVLDRFHATEYVYSIIERAEDEIDRSVALAVFREIAKELSWLDSFYVYVKPTDLLRSSAEHGKDLARYDALFDLLYEQNGCVNSIVVDYATLDDAVEEIGKCNAK